MPQAQSIAQAFNMPQLANVFYYGKDFSGKKQQLKGGRLEQDVYDPLSVTKAGAMGEMLEEAEREKIAEAKETKDNDINGLLDQIFGSGDAMSFDDLLDIVKRG